MTEPAPPAISSFIDNAVVLTGDISQSEALPTEPKAKSGTARIRMLHESFKLYCQFTLEMRHAHSDAYVFQLHPSPSLILDSTSGLTLQILQYARAILSDLIKPTLRDPTFLPRHSITFNLSIPDQPPDVVSLVMPSTTCCRWVIEGLPLDTRIIRMGDHSKALGPIWWIYH